jgi:enoyl-CoA hydratase
MRSYETLLVEVAGGIATVTLNRPDAMNALSAQLKDDLMTAFGQELPADDAVRAVVISGAGGKAFCAGADIKERSGSDLRPAEFVANQRRTHALFRAIERFPRPVIAAINGFALGGGTELALACDLRIAAESASLGLTEVNLGVIPAGGGTQRLARLVGSARAKELVFTAERIGAARALEIGLVNRVVPDAALAGEAAGLARTIAAKPPLAVRFAKEVIDRGLQTDLESGLEHELYAASILFDTEDRREGMRAFVEKRRPDFKGV